jgi:hypothetical protein
MSLKKIEENVAQPIFVKKYTTFIVEKSIENVRAACIIFKKINKVTKSLINKVNDSNRRNFAQSSHPVYG